MKNGDMPAIGHAGKIDVDGFACAPGLTKRELFAAMAMQGLLGNSDTDISGWGNQEVAEGAVNQADALLDALEKSK